MKCLSFLKLFQRTLNIIQTTPLIYVVFSVIVLKIKIIVDTKHNSGNTINVCLECSIISIFTKKSVPLTHRKEEI